VPFVLTAFSTGPGNYGASGIDVSADESGIKIAPGFLKNHLNLYWVDQENILFRSPK
jgi:hypothetical protein